MRNVKRKFEQSGMATIVTSALLGTALIFATNQISAEASKSAASMKNDLKIERATKLEQSVQNLLDAYVGDRDNVVDILMTKDMLYGSCVPYLSNRLPTPNSTIMRMEHRSPFSGNATAVEYEIKAVMMTPSKCGNVTTYVNAINALNIEAGVNLINDVGGVVRVGNVSGTGLINTLSKTLSNISGHDDDDHGDDDNRLYKMLGIEPTLGGLGSNLATTSTGPTADEVTNTWLNDIRAGTEPIRGRFLTKAMLDCDNATNAADTCVTRSRYLWKNQ